MIPEESSPTPIPSALSSPLFFTAEGTRVHTTDTSALLLQCVLCNTNKS